MRIAMDARMLGARLHGLGRYVHALASHLARLAPTDQFFLLGDSVHTRALAQAHDNVEVLHARSRPFSPAEHIELPRILKQLSPDLFHATSAAVPALTRIPFCVTIPDLIPLLFRPSLKYKLYFRGYLPAAVRRARRVLTFSQATADDLERHLGIKEAMVIPLGVEPQFNPSATAADADLDVPRPYLLAVGNPRPHKNLAMALQAFDALDDDAVYLVLLSSRGAALDQAISACRSRDRVVHLEYVDEGRLPALYRMAHAMFYPSLYEGFGLPVVEAMACGTVVVSSTASSLQEVLGDGGLAVDARDPGDCVAKLKRALYDNPLRAQLRKQGLEQAAKFTWEACAQQTLDVYRSCL